MQVDAAQVGEEPLQDVFVVLNGSQVVVGHDQRVQAGEHGAELADLGPVLEVVVGDVEQAQAGEGPTGDTQAAVAIKGQEQLLQPAGRHRTTWRLNIQQNTAFLHLECTNCLFSDPPHGN